MGDEDFSYLLGKSVEQIWVWGPIRVVLDIGAGQPPEMYVDVDLAVLTEPDGTETTLNAFERPGEAGTVLRLLHDRVESAHHREGVLYLAFASGAQLRALPDDQYESWTVEGGRRAFQCLPGGEVSSW
jgi:hypothetical protein